MKTFFPVEQVTRKQKAVPAITVHDGAHTTFMVDPPWPYEGMDAVSDKGKSWNAALTRGNAPRKYGSMSIEDLCKLSAKFKIADNAHLYLWVTNTFIEAGYQIARAWGFKPKTLITWTKLNSKGQVRTDGLGYYFRGATEHMLFGVRGKLRLQTRDAIPNAFTDYDLPHSVKPPKAYRLVEKASPGPYIEVFSRRQRPGWDVWGDQIQSSS